MAPKRDSRTLLHVAAVTSFLLATLSGRLASKAEAANSPALDGRPPSFSAIAKRTMPVVVNISTTAQRSPRSGSSDLSTSSSVVFLAMRRRGKAASAVWARAFSSVKTARFSRATTSCAMPTRSK